MPNNLLKIASLGFTGWQPVLLLCVLGVSAFVFGQTKPATQALPPTPPVVVTPPVVGVPPIVVPPLAKPSPAIAWLDSTFLHNAPVGLGLGLQPCGVVGMQAGSARDPKTLLLTGNLWMLEDRRADNSFVPAQLDKAYPVHFWEVLSKALTNIPQGGWVILDVEGAASYVPWCEFDANGKVDASHNAQAFTNWRKLIEAVRVIRPDVRISPILQWYAPDGSAWDGRVSWADVLICDQLFREQINPLIDALCLESYYRDYAAPPAGVKGDAFNWVGSDELRFGFRDHVNALHVWARTISGKAPVHLFSVANEWGSDPKTIDHFLSGPRMAACLGLIKSYQPAAIALWGVAPAETPFKCPDGWVIGSWDTKAAWVAEVSRAMK